ncbi:MAG: hypothetical protein KME06_12610 [Kastovskya adunca ATA6-11-RM4]|nr:hypothetical protein [Kastovskya adunca ATA6-11-RM4]
MLKLYHWGCLALVAALSAAPILAQETNFGTLKLKRGFEPAAGTAAGYTGGSFSLSAIANQDIEGNPCVGFGDSTPDHILILDENFPKLNVRVNSSGYDTTLVIRKTGGNIIRCNDDSDSSQNPSINAENWKAGEYEVWVGAIDAGTKRNYSISVRE